MGLGDWLMEDVLGVKSKAPETPGQNQQAQFGELGAAGHGWVDRYRQKGAQGVPVNYGMRDADNAGAQNAYNYGVSSLNRLEAAADGRVPSAAENQMQAGLDRSIRSQLAMAQSARGGGQASSAALSGAMRSGEQMQMENLRDKSALRANEQATARGQLAGAANQFYGTNIQARTASGAQALEEARLNAANQQFYEAQAQDVAKSQMGAGQYAQGLEQQRALDQSGKNERGVMGLLGMGMSAGTSVATALSDGAAKTGISAAAKATGPATDYATKGGGMDVMGTFAKTNAAIDAGRRDPTGGMATPSPAMRLGEAVMAVPNAAIAMPPPPSSFEADTRHYAESEQKPSALAQALSGAQQGLKEARMASGNAPTPVAVAVPMMSGSVAPTITMSDGRVKKDASSAGDQRLASNAFSALRSTEWAPDGSGSATVPMAVMDTGAGFSLVPMVSDSGRGGVRAEANNDDPMAKWERIQREKEGRRAAEEASSSSSQDRQATTPAASQRKRKKTPEELSAEADQMLAQMRASLSMPVAVQPALDRSQTISDGRAKAATHGQHVADSFLNSLRDSSASFQYKDPSLEPRTQPTGGTYLGVIAQGLEQNPELGHQLVSTGPDGMRRLENNALTSALAGGMGRLTERLERLEKRKGR